MTFSCRLACLRKRGALVRASRSELRVRPLPTNRTSTGTKFRVQDIPKELLGIAGTVIDHGLRLSKRW
jgi:hypothetical protein